MCCRMRIKLYYFLKMSFPHYLWSFSAKTFENLQIWKLENIWRFFWKKNVFILFKSIFSKIERRRICRCCRLSCLSSTWKRTKYLDVHSGVGHCSKILKIICNIPIKMIVVYCRCNMQCTLVSLKNRTPHCEKSFGRYTSEQKKY